MDEVLFRSSQKLENFQVQLSLAATHSKDIIQQCSQQSKSAILQAWNNQYLSQLKSNTKEIWQYILNTGTRLQEKLWNHLDPEKLYYNLVKVFWKKWTRRDACFMCAGFICGSIAGVIFALSIRKKEYVIRYMQAVQCVNYLGIESATVTENTKAPDLCGEDDVIITVKAASVQEIDAYVCQGYGKNLRKILKKLYNKHSKDILPVTLGRDCVGIITDIGSNVKRLEIGDEVWLTVPFWHEGTLSQSVLVSEFRVGRKPKNVGFEGACSLPYAGSIALNALKEVDVFEENAQDKKFLIVGGCTPVGCILVQILANWRGNVVATCTKKAVPVAQALGADDVIISPEPAVINETSVLSLELPQDSVNAFLKELELKDKFDFVIITKECSISRKSWENICNGKIVYTVPQKLASDSCGLIGGLVLSLYIRLKYIFEKVLGIPLNDFDEAHMCYTTLDELADMVENGSLQTVVDKVYHPQDIEIALNHIQSFDSIGSTVITFR